MYAYSAPALGDVIVPTTSGIVIVNPATGAKSDRFCTTSCVNGYIPVDVAVNRPTGDIIIAKNNPDSQSVITKLNLTTGEEILITSFPRNTFGYLKPFGISPIFGDDVIVAVSPTSLIAQRAVVSVNLTTGAQTIISCGTNCVSGFGSPSDVLLIGSNAGPIYQARYNPEGASAIVKIDRSTGAQNVLTVFDRATYGFFREPYFISRGYGSDGGILVSTPVGIVIVDLSTGAKTPLAACGGACIPSYGSPSSVIPFFTNTAYYLQARYNADGDSALVKRDRVTGAETVLTSFPVGIYGFFQNPYGIEQYFPFVITHVTTPPDTTIFQANYRQGKTGPTSSTTTFSFGGQGETATLSFECKLDSGPFTTCTNPTFYNRLADGGYTFQVRAVDATGNPDPIPDTFSWTNGS